MAPHDYGEMFVPVRYVGSPSYLVGQWTLPVAVLHPAANRIDGRRAEASASGMRAECQLTVVASQRRVKSRLVVVLTVVELSTMCHTRAVRRPRGTHLSCSYVGRPAGRDAPGRGRP